MREGKHPNGSRVHVIPIGEAGTQLYPDGPGRYATDTFPTGCCPPLVETDSGRVRLHLFHVRHNTGPMSARFADRLHITRIPTLVPHVCPLTLLTTRRIIWQY